MLPYICVHADCVRCLVRAVNLWPCGLELVTDKGHGVQMGRYYRYRRSIIAAVTGRML